MKERVGDGDDVCPATDMAENVHGIFIGNNPKLETTHMPVRARADVFTPWKQQ